MLSCSNTTKCSFCSDIIDLFQLSMIPVVENIPSTGTDDDDILVWTE